MTVAPAPTAMAEIESLKRDISASEKRAPKSAGSNKSSISLNLLNASQRTIIINNIAIDIVTHVSAFICRAL
ncbi:hypothetical protein SDC9_133595 [bioreactor metagenome]|uniref:Uncharacterized protein n=1 Tax=bioreactor metagenome TaxID=1076179 RepID=A0A645DAQ3_9ZZZZ